MTIDIVINFVISNLADVLIYLAGFLWAVELLPQIIKTHKTRNVEGLSFGFFMICLIAYLLYVTGNILLENWIIVYAHIPSIILNIIMLTMISCYRKAKNNEKEKGKIYQY